MKTTHFRVIRGFLAERIERTPSAGSDAVAVAILENIEKEASGETSRMPSSVWSTKQYEMGPSVDVVSRRSCLISPMLAAQSTASGGWASGALLGIRCKHSDGFNACSSDVEHSDLELFFLTHTSAKVLCNS